MFFSRLNAPRLWDPFADVNRVFSQLLDAEPQLADAGPVIELFHNDDKALLRAELPGFPADALDLSVHGPVLTLKAERPAPELPEGERVLRSERSVGKVQRQIRLPFEVEADKVSARYENGVLEVTLPRAEQDRPRRISIEG